MIGLGSYSSRSWKTVHDSPAEHVLVVFSGLRLEG
jgi:hypothetical protein